MNYNKSAIGLISELRQSESFGENYNHLLNFQGSNPVLNYFVKDIADYFNKILVECNELTSFQNLILNNIFIVFNEIQKTIDPERLSSFEYKFNSDDELVLFRNTNKGLINIIISADECFAFSFIPKNPVDQKSLLFYEEDFKDYEGLAYNFFS